MRVPTQTAEEARLLAMLQRWAEGRVTLKEVRGYTDEELYAVAKTAYVFFYQGRLNEARTLFQGLYAINPMDAYFAKALGVVELAADNVSGALAAYDVAVKLAPNDASALLGRAEVRIVQKQTALALEDLSRAAEVAEPEDPLREKALALIRFLSGHKPR